MMIMEMALTYRLVDKIKKTRVSTKKVPSNESSSHLGTLSTYINILFVIKMCVQRPAWAHSDGGD